MKQRWSDKEIKDRLIESMKNHWYHIDTTLKDEDGEEWSSKWIGIDKWQEYDPFITVSVYFIKQGQQILDITDEEVDELLHEAD